MKSKLLLTCAALLSLTACFDDEAPLCHTQNDLLTESFNNWANKVVAPDEESQKGMEDANAYVKVVDITDIREYRQKYVQDNVPYTKTRACSANIKFEIGMNGIKGTGSTDVDYLYYIAWNKDNDKQNMINTTSLDDLENTLTVIQKELVPQLQEAMQQTILMPIKIFKHFSTQKNYTGFDNLKQMHSSGILSDKMCENQECSKPKNPFGGKITLKVVDKGAQKASVRFDGLSKLICKQVAKEMPEVKSELKGLIVNPQKEITEKNWPTNVSLRYSETDAEKACSAKENSLVWIFSK